MSAGPVLDFIQSYPKTGRGLAMVRMKHAFGRLLARHGKGFPPVVHITGSNGKGSTTRILEAAFQEAGLRTGSFTSPHYLMVNERFGLNGADAPDEELERSVRAIEKIAAREAGFGGFEVMTLIAADLFLRHDLDALVIEAGIGGRFDSTRLFGGAISILTSVDLEHTEVLGNSREEIAADKMDILGPGGMVVTGWLGEDLHTFCREYAAVNGRVLNDLTGLSSIAHDADGTVTVTLRTAGEPIGMTWRPAIRADYFARNAVLAFEAFRRICPGHLGPQVIADAFTNALSRVRLIGRFEKLCEAPLIYCDFAHTPGAAREVVETSKRLFPGKRITAVVGISSDKKHDEITRIFSDAWSTFRVFNARHKGTAPAVLEAEIRAHNPRATVRRYGNAGELTRELKTHPPAADEVTIVTGGIFSVMEFRQAVLGAEAAGLRFF